MVLLLLGRLVRLFPVTFALAIARCLGLAWYYLVPVRRSLTFNNIRRTIGKDMTKAEIDALVRESFQRIAMYVTELFRLPYMTQDESRELVEKIGMEHIERGLARGKGVVLVGSHMDNVDLAGCSMAILGVPMTVIAKDIGWGPARTFVRAIRERTGVVLIPSSGSRDQIRDLLKQNKIVTIVIDQHIRSRFAIVCSFFGQLVSTTPAPARFALESDATVVIANMSRIGMTYKHRLRIEPFAMETPHQNVDADIRHNTERLNRVIESWIRASPGQWLWQHNRFKVHDEPGDWDIPPELRALAADSGSQGAKNQPRAN